MYSCGIEYKRDSHPPYLLFSVMIMRPLKGRDKMRGLMTIIGLQWREYQNGSYSLESLQTQNGGYYQCILHSNDFESVTQTFAGTNLHLTWNIN